MYKTSALIASAILFTSLTLQATPVNTPETTSSIGLLLLAIVGLVVARKWFRTA